jgi:hypothetical protein
MVEQDDGLLSAGIVTSAKHGVLRQGHGTFILFVVFFLRRPLC